MIETHRAFLEVGERRVHYRRAGVGPPGVMLHGSPASSEILRAEMTALGSASTCFAFDTPGFGDSDPLPVERPSMADLADALAETLSAIGMPPCVVYGSHTGAAIALEFGRRHPERTCGIVLDGVAMYDAAERAELFDGYFELLQVDQLGGHFAHVWTRFRDLFQWFPWTQPCPARLNEADLPSPEQLQRWVGMFYRAAAHYVPVYRAAIDYGSEAAAAVAALRIPAIFMAQDTDMLYPHLDRLPPLRANQCIVRTTRADHGDALVAAVATAAAAATAGHDGRSPPARSAPGFVSVPQGRWRRHFVDLPHGQVLVRHAGDLRHPVLLRLPDSPGSSLAFEREWPDSGAALCRVTLDLPGSGESPPLQSEPPPLSSHVDAVLALLDRMGVGRCAIEADGYSTALAVALARGRWQSLVSHLAHGARRARSLSLVRRTGRGTATRRVAARWRVAARADLRDTQTTAGLAPPDPGGSARRRRAAAAFVAGSVNAVAHRVDAPLRRVRRAAARTASGCNDVAGVGAARCGRRLASGIAGIAMRGPAPRLIDRARQVRECTVRARGVLMSASDTPARAPRKRVAKGPPRPQYLESPDVDKVVIMLLALAAEVSALRDRVDTHEALADEGSAPTRAAVEGHALPVERQGEREIRRQAMLRRVLRVLTEEVDVLREAGPPGA